MVLDLINRKHTNPERKNERKKLKWILVDSAIIGGVAVFACAPDAVPDLTDAWVMIKGFFAAFILQMAVERGIKRA